MATGTGLPYPKNDALLQPLQAMDGNAISSAADWARIADAGQRIAQTGISMHERDAQARHVGYLADQEIEISRKRIEMRDQFDGDPAGFDKAWMSYSEGKLSQSESWAVPHVKRRLGQEGNGAYGALLGDRRQKDHALDVGRIKALAQQSGDEVIGSAMAGSLNTEEGQARLTKLSAVYETAINAGLMTREEADLKMVDITSRAGAETVVKTIGDTYRENRSKGIDAGPLALEEAEQSLLRNQDERLKGLSEEQRYAYYHKATAEIRALESERRKDLSLARQAKTEAEAALTKGVRVSQDTVDEIVTQLDAAGGQAESARLRASVARHDQLSAYGRQPLAAQVQQYKAMSASVGANFAPDVASAINSAAAEAGVSPDLLRRYAQVESGGKADVVTGSYKGLFQLSDAEFAKHGGGDIFNPADNARAAARKISADAQAFKAQHGRDPSTLDLYMVHQQGAGGYAAHLANPSAPAWQNMAGTGEGRQRGEAWAKQAIWGNLPDSAKRRFGSVENVTSSDFVAVWQNRLGQGGAIEFGPGVDLKLATGQRKVLNEEAKEQWKKVSTGLDQGSRPDTQSIQTVIQAATLAGDHDLLEEIGSRIDRYDAGRLAARAPLSAQQGTVAEMHAKGSFEGLTPGQAAWLKDLEKTVAATEEKLDHDPIALAAERFPERYKMPEPFNLGDRDATRIALTGRAEMARFVGENYGRSNLPALSRADRTQFAGAIAGPDAKQAANALDALALLPDDNFAATLATDEIKTAIGGATRSADPAKFSAAMMSLDRMWARAPQEIARIFGEDTVKLVQDWQAKLRYHSGDQLSEILRKSDDPQVQKQHKDLETEARHILHKSRDGIRVRNIDTLLGDLDPGWFERAPRAPLDERTRDSAMADYESLFVERYASTRDKNQAHKQAIERMKLYWSKSEVNGGRLTLHAPETAYPADGRGSHEWMRTQLQADLTAKLGTVPDEWSVVADRNTETERAGGQMPSYQLVYKNKKGEVDVVRGPDNRPLRYRWDATEMQTKARDVFAQQRSRIFGAKDTAIDSSSVGVP